MDEGFVEYFLGEPIKKFPMNIGFDIVMYDLKFATQTVIEIICDIICMCILNFWYIKVSMFVKHPRE